MAAALASRGHRRGNANVGPIEVQRKGTRMRNMDQKGTVIFGRSGRAQIMALKYGAYTRILFILSICFTDFQSDSMVTEIAFKICRLWAVAVTRLYGASHSCFGFIISYKSGSICMPY